MPVVTFVEYDGKQHHLNLTEGQSVMQGAVNNMLTGIVGECSGSMACSTCHCFIDQEWMDKVGSASAAEQDLLDYSPVKTAPNSRLSCQITITDELDGLVVHMPESQY